MTYIRCRKIALGHKDGGFGLYRPKDDAWVACESRLPDPGRWVLLRVRRDGRQKHYVARLALSRRYFATYGPIEHCIRLGDNLGYSWWTNLPEWWEGFKEESNDD